MDSELINNIKSLGIDMINEAGSGHPGIVLGAAPIIYTLYTRHLNYNVNDLKWPNRDRFILSAGHGSALYYAISYMAGYLELEDLKKFRKIDSRTPGHPEYLKTPGVEMSTGPLGQGFATSVGMALAEKMLEERFKFNNKSLFNYHIYTLCSDGDLMEGVSYEAASLAGTLKLDNLIVLYDSNNVSLDGKTDFVFNENVRGRFEALGWDTILVKDGTSLSNIDDAISHAKKNKKPTLIEIKTILGHGSLKEGTNQVHGKILDVNDLAQLKLKLNMKEEPFYVLENARSNFQNLSHKHNSLAYDEWSKNYSEYVNLNGTSKLDEYFKDKEVSIFDLDINYDKDKKISGRDANKIVMNAIAKEMPNFITGSADLFASVRNYLEDYKDITPFDFSGRNIWFGVREHAEGAILNGLALSNFKVSGSTFLTFSDYMKPAMRLASLMNLPVTYVLSHDSIGIGSDGPTHQPVEQLATLRAMPNMLTFRPCDIKELIGTWNYILNEKNTPSSIILSKQDNFTLNETDAKKVSRGAYIVRKEETLHGIIIASGDEVHTALNIAKSLYEEYKLDLRVVSMPSLELFNMQSEEYKKEILQVGIRTIVLEASSSFGLEKFVYNDKYLFTIDHFGASGSRDEILKKFNYDFESLKEKIKKLFL